jgi:1-acyl-sn-glycerol-3-phosphate acyltransferase
MAELSRLKEQVYKDPRPKEYFDRFHERARTRDPDAVYEVVRVLTTLYALIAFRARSIGAENVPDSGPVILAPNHFSFMDHFFTGAFTRRRVRFMAKSQLFAWPMQWVYTHGGVFPVRRGHHDEEAFITAESILERDGAIVMYCEGGRSRTGEVAQRARPGIGRLALESGAPIVPVAILGSHQVRNWKRLQFPKVVVRYGEPLRFEAEHLPSRERQQQAADLILGRIRTMHSELSRQRGRASR